MNENEDIEYEFFKYLKIKEIQEDRKIKKTGGVIERVRIGEHNIEYDINSVENYNKKKKSIELWAQATKKANDKQPCFMMSIMPGGNATLISISRGVACFQDNHDISSDIVLAALEIAKQKVAKKFEFTDNSTKTVDHKKIDLADLSFLTTGQTWYERILPIKPSKEKVAIKIDKFRQQVKINTWSDVSDDLLRQSIGTDFDTNGIDINEAGSAMKVLDRAKLSKKHHLFFHDCMEELIVACKSFPLKGTEWIMDI